MYKDIISYELAEGVTEAHLLEVANEVLVTWMKELPGFVKWEIHRDGTNSYSDIVYWQSKEHAKKAEQEMINIPNASAWQACYKPGSFSSKNLTLLSSF